MSIRQIYEYGQFDLACLDTMCGDYEEYGHCLRFALHGASYEAVRQMFAANGACAFEDGERETREERLERWIGEEQRRAA